MLIYLSHDAVSQNQKFLAYWHQNQKCLAFMKSDRLLSLPLSLSLFLSIFVPVYLCLCLCLCLCFCLYLYLCLFYFYLCIISISTFISMSLYLWVSNPVSSLSLSLTRSNLGYFLSMLGNIRDGEDFIFSGYGSVRNKSPSFTLRRSRGEEGAQIPIMGFGQGSQWKRQANKICWLGPFSQFKVLFVLLLQINVLYAVLLCHICVKKKKSQSGKSCR